MQNGRFECETPNSRELKMTKMSRIVFIDLFILIRVEVLRHPMFTIRTLFTLNSAASLGDVTSSAVNG